MTRRLAFIGFGDLGRQVHHLVREAYGAADTVVFDDPAAKRREPGAHPFEAWRDQQFKDCLFFLGVGYHHLAQRVALLEELIAEGREAPAFFHPSGWKDSSVVLEPGVICYPRCTLDMNVRVEAGALLNLNVTVAHDGVIGRSSYLSPGVTVAGGVQIGARVFLGSGAVTANGLRIGDGATVGVGTVISDDIPPGATAIGNPMRFLDRPLKLR